MRDPAGSPPRSGHKWWQVIIYILGFLYIVFALYMGGEK